jgi:hypothetical protein
VRMWRMERPREGLGWGSLGVEVCDSIHGVLPVCVSDVA